MPLVTEAVDDPIQSDRPLLEGQENIEPDIENFQIAPPPKVNLGEDSDEGGSNFKKDADNLLSYERMVFQRNLKLPNKDGVMPHPICGTSTGWACCYRCSRRSDLREYGSGIVLYF